MNRPDMVVGEPLRWGKASASEASDAESVRSVCHGHVPGTVPTRIRDGLSRSMSVEGTRRRRVGSAEIVTRSQAALVWGAWRALLHAPTQGIAGSEETWS
jgi:hypothetical protein